MIFDNRYLPSMPALVAFESAARHSSFTAAASELNLTQSAVSRQIRQLENFLDVSLFRRIRQRVVLTDAGRLYLKDVAKLLSDLGVATQWVVASGGNTVNLNLAVLPSFATRWLIPRLPDFLATDPGVTFNLATRLSPFDFAKESFDAAIHYGDPSTWPGAVAHDLMKEWMAPLCSPKFQEEHEICGLKDLNKVTLLHQTTRPFAWQDWFRSVGILECHAVRGPSFEHFLMIAQAAVSGMGVALIPLFLVEDELASGKLVMPVGKAVLSDKSYHLMVPETKTGAPLITRFSNWLIEQGRSATENLPKPAPPPKVMPRKRAAKA